MLGEDYHSLADFDTEAEIALLVDILKYHVVAGAAAFSTDLSDGQHIETLLGDNIGVSLNGGVFITDASETAAEVILPDVEASNGVVHVINKVLLPQAALDFVASLQMKNIVELAQSVDELSILVEALVQADAGLLDALSSGGPLTVFAPTNDAFHHFCLVPWVMTTTALRTSIRKKRKNSLLRYSSIMSLQICSWQAVIFRDIFRYIPCKGKT